MSTAFDNQNPTSRGPSRKAALLARIVATAIALTSVALAPVLARATSAAAATTAGTNISNAAHLTGGATGSLASPLDDDWYVVYPGTLGAPVTIRVDDTTAPSPTCNNLNINFRDSHGLQILNVGLTPNTSYGSPFSRAGSDRYYVELDDGGCNPPGGHPVTYELTLESGGTGTAPNPAAGSAAAGATIGNTTTPLQGGRSYKGTIASGISDAWYVLYKHAGTAPATIRVENTTVKGSTSCANLNINYDNTDGGQLRNDGLVANTASTFSIAAAGRYYIQLNDGGCPDGGTTYRIEPEPAALWDNPLQPATTPLPTGTSLAHPGLLAGGVSYTGSIPTSTTQLFEEFDTNGKGPVTASVQDMTDNQANCQNVDASLLTAAGAPLQNIGLSDNRGGEFTVDQAGRFVLKLTDGGCTPAGGNPPRVKVTVTPTTGVTDQRIPGSQGRASAAVQALVKNYEGLPGTNGKPAVHAYNDSYNNCTVGWGHRLYAKVGTPCTAADKARTYTPTQLEAFWNSDLANIQATVRRSVASVPLLQREYDALVSFAYHEGSITGTNRETLGGDLLAKPPRYSAVGNAMMIYDTDGKGHVLCGTWVRLSDEKQMWNTGDYTRNFPTPPAGCQK